jgi:hypothetical protein
MENTINNKYANGKIYKITNNIDDVCYVGSTTRELNIRMSGHINQYKSWLKDNVKYITSCYLFSKYGLENCTIELLQLYPCLNKIELQDREVYYIKLLTSINKVIPGRTKHESYIDNKDKIAEYYIKNKDKIAEYYIKNKDKIAEYRAKNKDKMADKTAEYYIKNKDKIADKTAEHYIKNKNNICEQKRLKYLKT